VQRADVVSILQKAGGSPVADRQVQASAGAHPRYYLSVHLSGRSSVGVTRQGEAIDLSLEKYCSVTQSLNPDIRITYDVQLG
jgi:uncharacterized OsmC-like protein